MTKAQRRSADWSRKFVEFVQEMRRRVAENEGITPFEYLGDDAFHKYVLVQKAESWADFLAWTDELDDCWCFRGQREASWFLNTSLDRAVARWRSSQHGSSYYHLDRELEGRELLQRFQQYAHFYLTHIPASDDLSSWFALMQHHCVPTRLLDWTESPYVGMYFAVEDKAILKRPREKQCHSALWAIDLTWLESKGQELLRAKNKSTAKDFINYPAEYTNRLLRETEEGIVVKINPKLANPRIFAQRGIFLCKLYHEATFGQILMTMMIHPNTTERPVIRKLEIGNNLRISFLKQLRAMNIHRASLFPGLDGLGLSLKLDLELKDRDT